MKYLVLFTMLVASVFGVINGRYDYSVNNSFEDMIALPTANLSYQPSFAFQSHFDKFYTTCNLYGIKPYATTKTALRSDAFAYQIAGVKYTKAASTITLGASTIANTKYGCYRVEIDAASAPDGSDATVDVIKADGTDYNTAALAVAGLPAVQAGHISMGYIVIYNGTGGDFVCGTTAFYTTTLTQSFMTYTGDGGAVVTFYPDGCWIPYIGTPTMDITNNVTGESCINIVAGNNAALGAHIYTPFNAVIDMSHSTVHIRYKLVNKTGLILPGGGGNYPVQLYLVSNYGTSTGPALTQYCNISNMPSVTGEWHDLYVTRGGYAESASFVDTQVAGISLVCYDSTTDGGAASSNGVANIIVDCVEVYNNTVDTAQVCIGIDDAKSVQIPAIKYAVGKGVRVYWAIVTDYVGTTNYATWPQIKDLYDTGLVDIVVHRGYPDYTSEAGLRAYCRKAKQDILDQGFPAICADVFVMPAGTEGLYAPTVTTTHAADTFTISTGTLTTGDYVYLSGGTYTGSGLEASKPYYVVNASGSTGQLSLTAGGEAVPITADVSGTVYFLKINANTDTRNPTTADIKILREYFSKIRGTFAFYSGGGNRFSLGTTGYDIYYLPKVRPDRAWVWCGGIDVSTYQAKIAEAKTAGCIYTGYSHINGTDLTLANWKLVIDYIAAQVAAGNVTVKSLYEL